LISREEMLAGAGAAADFVVIGGGATGAGVAWEAVSRGLRVVLLEARDFGSGTSSRSTKLIHGGVRYLAQGRLGLVREALRERALLRRNAPELVRQLRFVVPVEGWRERCRFRAGLAAYDLLAGRGDFPPSAWLARTGLETLVPGLRPGVFTGAVSFHDGQFDDTALLFAVLEAASAGGARCINYAEVIDILKRADGRACGVRYVDRESGREHEVRAARVINATGPAADGVLRLDTPRGGPPLRLSRGSHLVFGPEFLGGDTAVLMPRVDDGRVMFAIPWQGHTLLGTTDVATAACEAEPVPTAGEISLLLETAARYLRRPPARGDVSAAFCGIRPLAGKPGARTARASREHSLHRADSGLVTVTGGKWTTFRRMAVEIVEFALHGSGLMAGTSGTASATLHAPRAAAEESSPLLPGLDLTEDGVRHAARHAMARRTEDVLARRCRALFLDARAALAAAPRVAAILGEELGRGPERVAADLAEFQQLAARYIVAPA
jgi:glycerol-3-phosphate dehydrogenase